MSTNKQTQMENDAVKGLEGLKATLHDEIHLRRKHQGQLSTKMLSLLFLTIHQYWLEKI
jgi:hypothetical protein